MYRDIVVATAKEFIGIKEMSPEHQTIVDIYNTIAPLPRGYSATISDPWCAIFVSAVFKLAGLADKLPTECSCTRMLNIYKTNPQMGSVVTKLEDPLFANVKPGDLIFYGNSKSPVGQSEHVGIIYGVNVNLTSIEGNWRNSVYLRMLERSWNGVSAYVHVKYPDEEWAEELESAKAWVMQEDIIRGDGTGIKWKEPVTLERLAVILKRLCA